MFSEPTTTSLVHAFTAPGLELEVAGACVFALGIAGYLARLTWLALSQARRIENEAMRQAAPAPRDYPNTEPYCAG